MLVDSPCAYIQTNYEASTTMTGADPKRKHVGNACQPCRSSKIKCDGATPACGNCSKKDKECHYPLKDDKRRVSLRTAVDILSSRVSVLSRVLSQNGIPIPTMDTEQEKTLKDICETLNIDLFASQDLGPEASLEQPGVLNPTSRISDWQTTDQVVAQTLQDPVFQTTAIPIVSRDATDGQDCLSVSDGYPTDGSTADWPWHIIEDDAFFLSGPLDFGPLDVNPSLLPRDTAPATSSNLNQNSGLNSGISSDEEPESDLVHEVSARFGALRVASDGQLRYYGAATNYHLLESSRHDEDVEIFTTRQEMLDRLEQAGLDQEIPTDLEEHLIDLYFTWHNPSHINVDRDTFLAARINTSDTAFNAGYASDVLLNAM